MYVYILSAKVDSIPPLPPISKSPLYTWFQGLDSKTKCWEDK